MPRTRKVDLQFVEEGHELVVGVNGNGAGEALNSSGSGSGSDTEDVKFCEACGKQMPVDAGFCPKCGQKKRRKEAASGCPAQRACKICSWACGGLLLFVAIFVAVLTWRLNAAAKLGLEQVGSAVLGTELTVGRVSIGLLQGRTSLTDLVIDNPEGYEGDFFKLGHFVFDMAPTSIFEAWLSDFVKPIALEQVVITNVDVFIQSNMDGSNAGTIVQHMNKVLPKGPEPPSGEELETDAVKAMSAKIQSRRIDIENITVYAQTNPLPEVSYELQSIRLNDIGKPGEGVYMYDFIDILVQAVLMAVVKAAPTNLETNLARLFGTDLAKSLESLDLSGLAYDAGAGLEEVSDFGIWAASEAAKAQLSMLNVGTKMNAKAIETGVKMNTKAIETGVKMNTEALKVGADLTTAGAKASLKATEAATKLSTAFVKGFTGLR